MDQLMGRMSRQFDRMEDDWKGIIPEVMREEGVRVNYVKLLFNCHWSVTIQQATMAEFPT